MEAERDSPKVSRVLCVESAHRTGLLRTQVALTLPDESLGFLPVTVSRAGTHSAMPRWLVHAAGILFVK
jgi:hypothetical protein